MNTFPPQSVQYSGVILDARAERAWRPDALTVPVFILDVMLGTGCFRGCMSCVFVRVRRPGGQTGCRRKVSHGLLFLSNGRQDECTSGECVEYMDTTRNGGLFLGSGGGDARGEIFIVIAVWLVD